jgi:predicted Zn-dependent protease
MNKNYWNNFCSEIFSMGTSGEELALFLKGEKSDFLRFNNSKLRQSTFVEQFFAEMILHKNNRRFVAQFPLTMNANRDQKTAATLIQRGRQEISVLPEDPHLVSMKNQGTSESIFLGKLPAAKEVAELIAEVHQHGGSNTKQSVDQSGFYCAGPLFRAQSNSLGQSHWYSAERFFYDYSLFTINSDGANKAVKASYSEKDWSGKNLHSQLQEKFALLRELKGKNKRLDPGTYRAYLAPEAIGEIATLLNWGAFSYSTFKQGKSALKQFAEGKESFSAKMNINENFNLGLAPQFNALGELAPAKLPVIQEGKLQNWLVSSRAAKEFGGFEANAGETGFRSLEILPGQLAMNKALSELGTGLYLGNLHYANWSDLTTARVTGMTRYACFWVENGQIVAPIEDMRFDESLYRIFGSQLIELTRETIIEPEILTYGMREVGGRSLPGFLLNEFRLTL